MNDNNEKDFKIKGNKGKNTNKNLPIVSNKILNNFSPKKNNVFQEKENDDNNNYKNFNFSKTYDKKSRGSILEYLEKSNANEKRKKTEEIKFFD